LQALKDVHPNLDYDPLTYFLLTCLPLYILCTFNNPGHSYGKHVSCDKHI